MHFTDPLKTGIIIQIFLMVTNTLCTTENTELVKSIYTTYPSMATTIPGQRITQSMQAELDSLRTIWDNIRSARRCVKKQARVIKDFYSKVKSIGLLKAIKYEWLPKEHLIWFEDKIRHLDKHKKVSIIIPVLNDSLTTFESTFEKMMNFDAEKQEAVQVSVYEKRRVILNQIVFSLSRAHKRIKAEMKTFDIDSTDTANFTKAENARNWDSQPDHTSVLIQDWGIINTYYKFLKDWVQITEYIYREYCSITRPMNKCHEYLNETSLSIKNINCD